VGFALSIVVSIAIFAILAVSFDLVLGYAGLFSVAHAAFFAIGAYTTALIALHTGAPILLAAAGAVLACAISSALLAVLVIRVSQDYLVIASFGFLTLVLAALANLPDLTGGTLGIGGIPPPSLFGWTVSGLLSYAIVFSLIAAVVVAVTWWLAHSPYGRALRAIRDNVVGAEALGKNPTFFRVTAFVIAGALAGIAGAMYATYISYISPDAFSNDVNILIFAMVVIGGAGTVVGPLVGAILLVSLPAVLSLLPLAPTLVGPVGQIIYGALLVAFAMSNADGLLGIFHSSDRWLRAQFKRTLTELERQ